MAHARESTGNKAHLHTCISLGQLREKPQKPLFGLLLLAQLLREGLESKGFENAIARLSKESAFSSLACSISISAFFLSPSFLFFSSSFFFISSSFLLWSASLFSLLALSSCSLRSCRSLISCSRFSRRSLQVSGSENIKFWSTMGFIKLRRVAYVTRTKLGVGYTVLANEATGVNRNTSGIL